MNQPNKINVEKMFTSIMSSVNVLIDKIETLDPTSEQYGNALTNLAKAFTILSGAAIKEDKQGK